MFESNDDFNFKTLIQNVFKFLHEIIFDGLLAALLTIIKISPLTLLKTRWQTNRHFNTIKNKMANKQTL